MFCSCDLCGWHRPQNGFQYFFAFRRRPAQIFFDKLAGSSKSIVFFRVLSHMADTKTSRPKKKCISSQRCDIFFGFQILINGHVHQASQLHQPAWRTKPASQPASQAHQASLDNPARLGHQASQTCAQSRLGAPSQPQACQAVW